MLKSATGKDNHGNEKRSASSGIAIRLVLWSVGILLFCSAISLILVLIEPVKSMRFLHGCRDQIEAAFKPKAKRRSRFISNYRPVDILPRNTGESKRNGWPIRLLDTALDSSSTSSLKKMLVSLDGQARNSIAGSIPFEFSCRIHVPQHGSLWVGLNQEGESDSSSETQFAIWTQYKADKRYLLRANLSSNHTGWQDRIIDLSPFEGNDILMHFEVYEASLRQDRSGIAKKRKAYWSDLFVYSDPELKQRPNTYLILIDTLRPDHLGCYGYARETSPSIDTIASQGILFENAFSTSSWTDPSVLTLFTGLYPSDVWDLKPYKKMIREAIPEQVASLSEVLSRNGYFTIALSDHPGINEFRFGKGFDIYANLSSANERYLHWRKTSKTDVLAQIKTLVQDRSSSGLFVYIHLIYPHLPYLPESPYDKYFGRGAFYFDSDSADKKPAILNMYDGEIRLTDDVIGTWLGDVKPDNNSITIIVADHGEGFWEHGLFEHGNSLYNELLHIPLIISAPRNLPHGNRIKELVSLVDVFPTILELLDIENKQALRGRSLLPLINGYRDDERYAFSEYPYSRITRGRAIQSRSEKIIDPGIQGSSIEHYQIRDDPNETKNLGDKQAAEITGLVSAMQAIGVSARTNRSAIRPRQVKPSEEAIKKLKSLGYLK